jgi:hypothetical protein
VNKELVIWLSILTASVSFTVTETKLFSPLRVWITRQSNFLGHLINCGYCTGHWIAFILVAAYQPRLFHIHGLTDYFFTALVIAWLGGVQWAIMCWLMKITGK